MTRCGDTAGERDALTADDPAMQVALDWFVCLQDDQATAEDRRAFRAWYDADPRHRAAYDRIEAVWRAPALAQAARRSEARHADVREPARRRPRLRVAALASTAVLLLAALGTYLDLPLRLQADHLTATGEQRRIALADGSQVLLDSASAIEVGFDSPRRQVRLLAGRAYFEVAPGRRQPFAVRAGSAVIEVTGTRFAVALAAQETTITLREGRLRVMRPGRPGDARQLHAGERLQVGAETIGAPHRVAFREASGWVRNRLIFQNRRLGAVLDELGRYHAGLIVVADPGLKDLHVTGNYRLDDPVRVVEQLARLAAADLVKVSDRLLILH